MNRDDLIDMAVREAMDHYGAGVYMSPHYCLTLSRCWTCENRIHNRVQSNWPRHLEAVKGSQ